MSWRALRIQARLEEFFTRVPSTTKAGIIYNRDKRQRAEIHRWAHRNGYYPTGQRSIPPAVRRGYEEAQVAAAAKLPEPIAGTPHEDEARDTGRLVGGNPAAIVDDRDGRRDDGIDEQTREQILQAYATGATVASVKTTFNVSFETG
jgi:hypothetical protein